MRSQRIGAVDLDLEASELRDALDVVVVHSVRNQHEHVADDTHQREVTTTVYVPENLDRYDARSPDLISDEGRQTSGALQ